MKYRGYNIVKAIHPTRYNPNQEAYDIMDGDRVRKSNIATVETARHVIDSMLKHSMWPDRSDAVNVENVDKVVES